MNPENITTKKFITFMLIAFGIAGIPLWLAGFMNAGGQVIGCLFLFRFIAVFIPFMAVLISRLPLKEIGFGIKTKFKYILAAWIAPQILAAIGTTAFFLIFPDSFKLGFDAFTSTLPEDMAALYDPSVINPAAFLIVMTFMAFTFIPLSQILPSLGEEAGWRGVLYPFLKNKFGKLGGRLIGGALWGIWHWPLLIAGAYFFGNQYWGYPVVGPVVICIALTAYGIFIDWLYEKTHSIWVASIAHSAMNAASVPMMLLGASADPKLSVLGPSAFSLIPLIPMIVVAAVICLKKDKKAVS
jgi:membrane protease YdiL (CAAX protease family)